VVVVPAADEQEHLPACLAAVEVAADAAARLGVRVRVVVVLDGCTDGSAEVVARTAGVEAVAVDARCVGTARAAGARHALDGQTELSSVWLANTDADSQVPADWLTHMLDEADRGAHLVLGTVIPQLASTDRMLELWTARHSAFDGHEHVHGANLGVRADVYEAAGGWASLACGEDVELATRALAVPGAVVRRSARTPVRTSGRTTGRAPDGFAAYLRALEDESGAVAG